MYRVAATNTNLRVDDTAPLPTFTLYDGADLADPSEWSSAQLVLNTSTGEYVSVETLSFVVGATSSSTLALSAWSTQSNGSSGEYRGVVQVTDTGGLRRSSYSFPVTFHGEASTSS